MLSVRSFLYQLPKLFLVVVFLMGGLVTAQSAPKLKKDGKYKAKKNKVADHHGRMVEKKKHHKVDWNQHNKVENQAFSKKKKKKLK
jgi:hypothetical protein